MTTPNQNWYPPVRLDKNGKAGFRCLVITMKGEGWISVGYCLLGGGVGPELGTLKFIGNNTLQCLYKGLQAVCENMREFVKEGDKVELISDFVPISLFNPFIYCGKVDDPLSVLCEMKVKSGNRVVLRSHREEGSPLEVLRRLEGALASESVLGCTHVALDDPGEVKSTIKASGSHQWQSLWRKPPQCRQTKIWLPDVQRSIIGEMPSINRV